jgi:hypothetical protein
MKYVGILGVLFILFSVQELSASALLRRSPYVSLNDHQAARSEKHLQKDSLGFTLGGFIQNCREFVSLDENSQASFKKMNKDAEEFFEDIQFLNSVGVTKRTLFLQIEF